jgi:hypothetical protein
MSNPPENNLTTKFTALQELMTTQHQETLTAIWGLAGPAPGVNLTQIAALLTKISNGIGGFPDGATLPGGVAILSAREYLSQINTSAAFLSILLDATGYAGSETILSTLKLLLEQFNTSVVYPTMKDLMMSLNGNIALITGNTADPMEVTPVGICVTPFTSVGTIAVPVSGVVVQPITVAMWDFSSTTEFEQGLISHTIRVTVEPAVWTGYRFYVASIASLCGVKMLWNTRYPTNQWFTLVDEGFGELQFTVDGENDLKVYICGANSPLANCSDSPLDPLIPSGWRKPSPTDIYWEMGSGYNNGGITWTVDVNVPHATGWGVGDIATRPAFSITTDAFGPDANICMSWEGLRPTEYIRIWEWKVGAGGWEQGMTINDSATQNMASGAITFHNVKSGMNYAYTVVVVTDTPTDTAPVATVSIDLIPPPGWGGT